LTLFARTRVASRQRSLEGSSLPKADMINILEIKSAYYKPV